MASVVATELIKEIYTRVKRELLDAMHCRVLWQDSQQKCCLLFYGFYRDQSSQCPEYENPAK